MAVQDMPTFRVRDPIDPKVEEPQLAEILDKYYIKCLFAVHEALKIAVPPLSSWEVYDAHIGNLLVYSAGSVTGVTERIKGKIVSELIDAAEQGLSIEDVAKRIDTLYTKTWKYRAQTIARTELGAAALTACQDRYLASDVVKEMEILDGDYDAECKSRNGKRVPLSETVELNHPNCVVTVAPILKPESEIPKAQPDANLSVPDFEPKRTPAEAQKWLEKHFPSTQFDFKGMDRGCANNVALEFVRLHRLFPQVTVNFAYVGTQVDKPNVSVPPPGGTGRIQGWPSLGGNTYAHAWSGWNRESGTLVYKHCIGLNPKHFNDYNNLTASLLSDVGSGWHPKGCDSPESIFTHEFGHSLDSYLKDARGKGFFEVRGLNYEGTYYALLKAFRAKFKATASLSDYALKTEGEAFAEAFASMRYTKDADKDDFTRHFEKMIEKVRTSRKYDAEDGSMQSPHTLPSGDLYSNHNIGSRWTALLKELGIK